MASDRPVPEYIANSNRVRTLWRRLAFLEALCNEDRANSYQRQERSALDWALRQLDRGWVVKIKTSELTSAALDWAVAVADKRNPHVRKTPFHGQIPYQPRMYIMCWDEDEAGYFIWSPSELWDHGGPILEREVCQVIRCSSSEGGKTDVWWEAGSLGGPGDHGPSDVEGPHPSHRRHALLRRQQAGR